MEYVRRKGSIQQQIYLFVLRVFQYVPVRQDATISTVHKTRWWAALRSQTETALLFCCTHDWYCLCMLLRVLSKAFTLLSKMFFFRDVSWSI